MRRTRKSIVVIKGGLGNQLFQLCIANFLQQNGGSVALYHRHLPAAKKVGRDGIDVWPNQILNLTPPGMKSKSKASGNPMFSRALLSLDLKFGQLRQKTNMKFKRWINTDLATADFDIALETFPRWINYSGASKLAAISSREWLAERFYSACQSSDDLKWRESASRVRPLMVHWRRGDFIGLEHLYGYLGPEYYRAGVSSLGLQGQEVWLFTDAVGEEAELMKNSLGASEVFDGESKLSALSTLSLLSHNNGLVCSNSTFSWWAAYLSKERRIHDPSTVLDCPNNIFLENPLQ